MDSPAQERLPTSEDGPAPDHAGLVRLLEALAGDCDEGELNDWEAHEWADAAKLLRNAAAALSTPSPLPEEVVSGFAYDDWSDDTPHDDDKVRIGDFCHFNLQDQFGVDHEEFNGKIVRHHTNGLPVVVTDLEQKDGGDYVSLQALFMANWSFSRISESEALAKLEQAGVK